jgi:DNA-binding SARP family transcriptional activator
MRARLLDQFRAVHADLIDARLALGQHRSVLPDLRAMVAEDPLHEHSWAQLMTALYCAGSRAEALSCYRDIRSALAHGHGIDPGPELQDLHARILRDDPTLFVSSAGSDGRIPRNSLAVSQAESTEVSVAVRSMNSC